MRILLVNDYGVPAGGAEVGCLGLRNELRARGHDARLFVSTARPVPGPDEGDYHCLGTVSRFRTLLQSANPWAWSSLGRVLREFQPDVVHVRMFLTQLSPLILTLLETTPALYDIAWYRPVCPLGTKRLPDGSACTVRYGRACYENRCLPLRDWAPLMTQMRMFERWRGRFRLYITISESMRETLESEGISPVTVVHPGVPERTARPPLENPPTVAFAGRLVPEKGADALLEAFALVAARIPPARLLIAGCGPERERLGRLCRRLGLDGRVKWLGHISRQTLENRFDGAWVQAVPGRWAEPFGLVAAEAMMRGTAVVASGSGGLNEIVRDHETGLLTPPGDAEALAAALARILESKQLAESYGAAGRRRALQCFSEHAMVGRFLELYEWLASGGCA